MVLEVSFLRASVGETAALLLGRGQGPRLPRRTADTHLSPTSQAKAPLTVLGVHWLSSPIRPTVDRKHSKGNRYLRSTRAVFLITLHRQDSGGLWRGRSHCGLQGIRRRPEVQRVCVGYCECRAASSEGLECRGVCPRDSHCVPVPVTSGEPLPRPCRKHSQVLSAPGGNSTVGLSLGSTGAPLLPMGGGQVGSGAQACRSPLPRTPCCVRWALRGLAVVPTGDCPPASQPAFPGALYSACFVP